MRRNHLHVLVLVASGAFAEHSVADELTRDAALGGAVGGAIGGAIGTTGRYWLSGVVARLFGETFPWGTLAVNVVGSFFLGVVMALVLRERLGETARLALGTGVMGGFTTYSAFNYETLAFVQAGQAGRAALYAGVTLAGCLLVGFAGVLLGRSL